MQAISGSVNLKPATTKAVEGESLTSEIGEDMASELGFLALFQNQINPAVADLNLLKEQLASGTLDGKLFPSGMPERPILSQLLLGGQGGQGAQLGQGVQIEQMMDSKLFSNINSEMLSAQNFLEALQGEGDSDTDIARHLIQESTGSSLRGKSSTGATGFTAITHQLGTQNWGDELVSRVKWQIGQTIQEAKISLNPRELGPLQIKINIIDDQAHVQFVANNSSVKEAIEEAIPRLREMLEEAGLTLADADVSQQSSDKDRTAAELADTNNEQLAESDLEEGEEQQVKVIRQGVGLVDHFI